MANLSQDDLTRDMVLTESGHVYAAGMVAKLLTVIDEVAGSEKPSPTLGSPGA